MSIKFAIDGNEDNVAALGTQSVVTAASAAVVFTCTYPMTIDIKQDFTVSGASVVDTMTGTGSLAAVFTMILNNGGPVHFQQKFVKSTNALIQLLTII